MNKILGKAHFSKSVWANLHFAQIFEETLIVLNFPKTLKSFTGYIFLQCCPNLLNIQIICSLQFRKMTAKLLTDLTNLQYQCS